MNPYQVLGVAENATDEQIKNAYRELAKKYHPDNYSDSPLADVAEQKMKEINEAYDTICDMRKNVSSSSAYNAGNSYRNYTHTSFPDVRRYIKEGRLDDALQILNGVSAVSRNAEWHFLMGMVFSRKGWTEQAYSYFQTACKMDPSNQEFVSALNNMNARRSYNPAGYNTVNPAGCSVCDLCTGLMCANCCCDCCGGNGCC